MELYDVMRTTGAVRRFADEPLPDEVLERILDNARFAPSGGNRQGARVIVVRDRATREAIVELSVTGAQRYLAQTKNGEGPWNPVQPMKVSAEEVAATRGAALSGRARAQRRGRARGLRRPQRLRGVRPVPRPHRRHPRRIRLPVRLEHPAGRAQ